MPFVPAVDVEQFIQTGSEVASDLLRDLGATVLCYQWLLALGPRRRRGSSKAEVQCRCGRWLDDVGGSCVGVG